ncbi:hypothetical protein C8R46DRAFT_1213964 [Mycena filopes]|nr:hypothetical protein C8R46DRAFT_1213964 [Mycena filopes]
MDANDLEKYACQRPCTFVPTTPTSPHSTRILVPLCGPHRLGKIGSAYPYALQSPGPRVIKQIPRQAHWHVRSNIRRVFPFVGKLVFFPALIAVSSFLFECNNLDYSANKFGASNPLVRSKYPFGFLFVGKLVRFPTLIAVSSFLFKECNNLDYSANKFGASNPLVRSKYPFGFLFVGKLVFFPARIAVSSFLFVPIQPLHRDKDAFNDD